MCPEKSQMDWPSRTLHSSRQFSADETVVSDWLEVDPHLNRTTQGLMETCRLLGGKSGSRWPTQEFEAERN